MPRYSISARRQAAPRTSLVLLLVLALPLLSSASYADSSEAENRSFVDSVGAMIYGLAWPTAEYERVSFGDARETSAGLEITFRVHGRSAFGGGPLWTDVTLEVSNGQITDLRWGDNNAILAQPGETIKAFGQALADLSEQYSASSAGGGSARSATSSSDVLATQFTELRTELGKRGFQETHTVYTDKLNAGGTQNISVTLQAGKSYLIVGSCDQDCKDLDLRLYDSAGNLIISDVDEDDHPVVAVVPNRTAGYTIKAIMAHCSRPPCYFGTQVFSE